MPSTKNPRATPEHGKQQQPDPPAVSAEEAAEREWDDIVDQSSDESFPASDPPIWATGQKRNEQKS